MPKKVAIKKRKDVRYLILISPDDDRRIRKYLSAKKLGKSGFGRDAMISEVEAWENSL